MQNNCMKIFDNYNYDWILLLIIICNGLYWWLGKKKKKMVTKKEMLWYMFHRRWEFVVFVLIRSQACVYRRSRCSALKGRRRSITKSFDRIQQSEFVSGKTSQHKKKKKNSAFVIGAMVTAVSFRLYFPIISLHWRHELKGRLFFFLFRLIGY